MAGLSRHHSWLLRHRTAAAHRSAASQRFFQNEIAEPLGLDVYIRLPESIPNSKLAKIEQPSLIARLTGFPIGLALASLNPRSHNRRALAGSELPHDDQHIYSRNLEVPSAEASARHAPSHAPTVCLRPAGGGWGCAP